MRGRLEIGGVGVGAGAATLDGREGWSGAFAEVAAEEVSTD